ncbi:MAG TPA: hypothetical protein VF186_06910 [Gaiellaceae bacterium]
MSARVAVDRLIEALAQAEGGLPAGSRFRPWLARARTDLLDLGAAGRIAPERIDWLEARLDELVRERPAWPLLAVPASPAAMRLRRAALLSRRAARLVRRDRGDRESAAYLFALGRLLAAIAHRLDGDAAAHVRERVPLPHATRRALSGGLAPG